MLFMKQMSDDGLPYSRVPSCHRSPPTTQGSSGQPWGSRRPASCFACGRTGIRPAALAYAVLCALLYVSIAKAQLQVSDKLRFTLTDVEPSLGEFGFLIFASGGEVTGLRGRVREIKDPDGHPIALEAVSLHLNEQTVPTGGTQALLRVQVGMLRVPGEYQVTLFFEGNAPGPVAVIRTLTLIREKSALSLDAWKDLTIRLQRTFPWSTASQRFVVPVENHGRSAVPELSIGTQAIVSKDAKGRKELAHGTISAKLQRPSGAVAVAAGGQSPVDLTFSDFSTAGAFQTNFFFSSPSMEAPQQVPVQIEVSDGLFVPLLTILLGVVLAFLVTYVSGTWRKREEARFRIILLRSDIEQRHANCLSIRKLSTLDGLLQKLRDIERRIALGDLATLSKGVDEVEEHLRNFLRTEMEQRNTIINNLEIARQQASQFVARRAELSPDQHAVLETTQAQLEQTSSQVSTGHLDAAEDAVKAVAATLQRLSSELQSRSLDDDVATPFSAPSHAVAVGNSKDTEQSVRIVQHRLWLADLALSGLSLLLASLTGISALYLGKVFGTPGDYLAAFLWGFGIDSSVKSLAAILATVRGPRAT